MKQQSGSVVIYLFFAIALFAALTVSIMRGNEYDNPDREKIRMNLNVMQSFGSNISHAIKRLKANGCTNEMISFKHIFSSSYNNSFSPSDKSCHVFDINGGGLDYKPPPDYIASETAAVDWWDGTYTFTSGVNIPDIGTDDDDLLMFVKIKSKKTCDIINDMLNGAEAPFIGGYCSTPYNGVFQNYCGATQDWTNAAGQTSGCVYGGTPTKYTYYQVLINR